ncbi:MAG: FG-GAP-like repeat-containing protein [Bacteroidota bacterium]|nr:FG-GAP-like repeat-containing protein [Bacteroidota bacterium]
MRTIVISFILLFAYAKTHSQAFPKYYTSSTGVKVLAGTVFLPGDTLLMPFTNGMLRPGFSQIDLNGDNRPDLFAFDGADNSVLCFINQGDDKYEYSPEYSDLFPTLIEWATLIDYNTDGKSDIICYSSEGSGIDVYLNIGIGKGINQFKKIYTRILYQDFNFKSNIFAGRYDRPWIGDINGDGDLDLLTYDVSQSSVNLYLNERKINGKSKDSLNFRLVDRCWGKFQTTFSDTVELFRGCGRQGKNSAHGSSAIVAIDLDNDGDFDALNCNLFSDNILQVINGKKQSIINTDSIISQSRNFPSYNRGVKMENYPIPALLDLNLDGKKDMIVSQNSDVLTFAQKHIWYYPNVTGNINPKFSFATDTFLLKDILWTGGRAYPCFWDYNADGLTDLLLGCNSKTETEVVKLYKNVGNQTEAVFVQVSNNLVGVLSGSYNHFTAVDLDDDGKQDLIAVNQAGSWTAWKNAGLSNQIPILSANTNWTNGLPKYNFTVPSLGDIDVDGDKDLILGKKDGTFAYIQNVGNKSNPSWNNVTDSIIGIRTNYYFYEYVYNQVTGEIIDSTLSKDPNGYSAPTLADINGDGKLDLVSGSVNGQLFVWSNIYQTITIGIVNKIDSLIMNKMLNRSSRINLGSLSAPATIDLNNDQIPEILVGNYKGGLILLGTKFKQIIAGIPNVSAKIQKFQLNIYPNPANQGKASIQIPNDLSNNITITIQDITGKTFATSFISSSKKELKLEFDLKPGLYIVKLNDSYRYYTAKLIVN